MKYFLWLNFKYFQKSEIAKLSILYSDIEMTQLINFTIVYYTLVLQQIELIFVENVPFQAIHGAFKEY